MSQLIEIVCSPKLGLIVLVCLAGMFVARGCDGEPRPRKFRG